MKNNEQEIRRFAKKWSSCLVDIDLKAHKIQEDACLSDLTALISEHYYPKEFVEWYIFSHHLFGRIENKSFFVNFKLGSDKKFTLDELFNYWRENKR